MVIIETCIRSDYKLKSFIIITFCASQPITTEPNELTRADLVPFKCIHPAPIKNINYDECSIDEQKDKEDECLYGGSFSIITALGLTSILLDIKPLRLSINSRLAHHPLNLIRITSSGHRRDGETSRIFVNQNLIQWKPRHSNLSPSFFFSLIARRLHKNDHIKIPQRPLSINKISASINNNSSNDLAYFPSSRILLHKYPSTYLNKSFQTSTFPYSNPLATIITDNTHFAHYSTTHHRIKNITNHYH